MKTSYLIKILVLLCAVYSCKESPREHYAKLLQEWIGKELQFPDNPKFTILGQDTVNFPLEANYKILTYVDSMGCISCKLQLSRWKAYMEEKDVASVRFLFFFSPEKKRDILGTLKANAFTHPVCINEMNELNRLNHFPTEFGGQTFLLDRNNRILAIGNPIHNPKVKELYLKIIKGETATNDSKTDKPMTTASIDRTSADMGTFDWQQPQTSTFTLTNTGDKPLAIDMVDTSCGCVTVDYEQEPVRPGNSVALRVTYKADQPEYFSKTVTVYCNTKNSPIRLTVKGNTIRDTNEKE